MTVYALRDLLRVPGLLSLSRLPLGLVFARTVRRSPRAALAVLGLAGASDVLDGWYARRFEVATPTGAVADAIADKVFVAAVVGTLVASRALSPLQAMLLGTRELGELAIGARLAAGDDPRLARSRAPHALGKATTVLQYAAVVAALLRRRYVDVLALAAAQTGVLATAAYWARETGAATGPSPRIAGAGGVRIDVVHSDPSAARSKSGIVGT